MKIGFIGTGNMGSSIIKGILSSKFEKYIANELPKER